MNALKKALSCLMVLSLLLVPVAGFADTNDGVGGLITGNETTVSTSGVVSATEMPIFTDEGTDLKIKVGLKYKGQASLNNKPFRFFSIEPLLTSEIIKTLKLTQSNYTQYLEDLVVELDENGNLVTDYFAFDFGVTSDAVNGQYQLDFVVSYIDYYDETKTLVTETIPVFFRIENGKKPASGNEGGGGTPTQNPSKAMLLLESHTRSPESITAGEEFDLTLVFRNTTKKTITDVMGTISDELLTMLPASGSNNMYIAEVKPGETAEFTVRISTTPNCGIAPAVLNIKYSFVQSKMSYESTDSLTIPVRQQPNLSLDTPNYATEIFQGDSVNFYMNLFNKGKVTIYNVSVHLECEGLTAEETYFAGNMDSGVTKTYDVMATADPELSGPIEGNIVVTYQDDYGVENTKKVPIAINVLAMDTGMDMPGMIIDDGMVEPIDTMPEQGGMPLWGWIAIGAGVAVVAVIVIVVIVKKRKNKKELEDELD